MGWNYLNSKVTLSLPTVGAWATKDVSGDISSSAVQSIMINITWQASTSQAGAQAIGNSNNLNPTIRDYGQRLMIIPLSESKTFAYYKANAATTFYIMAESDDKTGLIENSLTNIFTGGAGSYNGYSIPSPPSDGEIALVNIYNTSATEYLASVDESNDLYYQIYSSQLTMAFAPIVTGAIRYEIENAAVDGYYAGYLPNSKILSPKESHALSSADWNVITPLTVPGNAALVLLHVHTASACKMAARNYGSSQAISGSQLISAGNHLWWMVNLTDGKFEVYTDNATPSDVTVNIIGYLDYTIVKEMNSLGFSLAVGEMDAETIGRSGINLELDLNI